MISRRSLLKNYGRCVLVLAALGNTDKGLFGYASAEPLAAPGMSKEKWMAAWMDGPTAKDAIGQLWLGRFLDPMYFVLKSIAWTPNPPQTGIYEPVEVPPGFVTDLASIPWPLWSTGLRPDGQYAFAAIVHDYLYWTQTRTRKEADEILKLCMQDLQVSAITIDAIYGGVRVGGERAWEANAALQARGERRILKQYPQTATVKWAEWKNRPDVFSTDLETPKKL